MELNLLRDLKNNLENNTIVKTFLKELGEYVTNNIENKKALPSMQMFLYICEYLDISPKDFFDDEINEPNAYNNAVDTFKSLSAKQLELFISLASEMK